MAYTSDFSKSSIQHGKENLSDIGKDGAGKADIPPERTSTSVLDNVADEKAEPATANEPSPRSIHGVKWVTVITAILSSIFLFSLDNTVVADVQPAIVERFGEVNKLPWISVTFLLAAASMNLIFGKIFGQFNAKWTYIVCVIIFELGSALCGAATSMNMLIVGRAVCGLGGSGLYIGVMTLLSVTTTVSERPMYIGLTGLMWGTGTVLGPVVGGAFADSSAGWRWAFYINLCIGGLFAPVYIFMLPSFDPRPGVAFKERCLEMDFVGTIVLVGAFVSGVMAISFGGVLYAWSSSAIITCFVVSAVLFAVFAVQQEFAILTTQERRIFPVEFLRSRSLIILFAMTSCAAASMVVPLYMIPLFFQFTRGDSALDAAVRLLPYIIVMVFACICNGALLSTYGLYMPWYLFGGSFVVIGAALMHTVDTSTSTSAVYGYSSLSGLGIGMFLQASFSVAQALVAPVDIPAAVGFISTGQITGITLGLAVANSVFLNKAESNIKVILPNASLGEIQAAILGVGSQFVKGLPADSRTAVIDAIVKAMSKTYFGVIAAGSLVVVMSFFLRRERLFLSLPTGGA
ncbi:MFS general substrate transporter [Stipitochalara longipes BDJ]|nr:MFS general substrate transporter [Stipitochalara longipes BDJ]